ncbi:glycosyltransferase involved in cell wall biosynthesis [Saccharomonospora amisosensis]|uniref:Glycosyltransferase involved in cell wall biosynthesis n=1 Tax=Saccharomonospora amisosensis TaxID=1128677 RepID=A0A7X5ZSI6_9PSEU|nr:glycosyltransferase family 1 protein [Saccharomonospora amisosensis]NIJ14004.1 glycosyltransferase involved in cell wall biosynthesis [Saccharomonospora amisosensis]
MPELVVVAEQLLAPVPGGTGRYTAELLRALALTVPPGWTLSSVVAYHRDVEPARVAGVRGPRVLPLPPRALVSAWQAGLALWPGGAGVHAPTPLAPPRARRGSTLSVTAHDTVPWTHPGTLTPRGVRWHRAMIRRAALRADALVVPTESVATELAEYVEPRAAVHVIGHGVSELGVPAAMDLPERYVLAVGTIEPRKGIDVLVEAMALLRATGQQVPLLLAGQPGWGGLDPERLAREHGLPQGAVRVLGRVTDAELAAVLRGACVVAAPSMAEGFGLVVLEAMAAGIPVVHSDAPALVEVAGGAGLVVPRGDARALAASLREVLGSPARAAELAEAGKARAAEFSWREAARRVWALHADVS